MLKTLNIAKALFVLMFVVVCKLAVLAIEIFVLIVDILINLEDDNPKSKSTKEGPGPYLNLATGEYDPVKNGIDCYSDD